MPLRDLKAICPINCENNFWEPLGYVLLIIFYVDPAFSYKTPLDYSFTMKQNIKSKYKLFVDVIGLITRSK